VSHDDQRRRSHASPGHEYADAPYAVALQRARRERPRRRAADRGDEFTPVAEA
jgi:hypothetical protein